MPFEREKAILVLKIYIRVLLYVKNSYTTYNKKQNIGTFLDYLTNLVSTNKRNHYDLTSNDYKSLDVTYLETIVNKHLLSLGEQDNGANDMDDDCASQSSAPPPPNPAAAAAGAPPPPPPPHAVPPPPPPYPAAAAGAAAGAPPPPHPAAAAAGAPPPPPHAATAAVAPPVLPYISLITVPPALSAASVKLTKGKRPHYIFDDYYTQLLNWQDWNNIESDFTQEGTIAMYNKLKACTSDTNNEHYDRCLTIIEQLEENPNIIAYLEKGTPAGGPARAAEPGATAGPSSTAGPATAGPATRGQERKNSYYIVDHNILDYEKLCEYIRNFDNNLIDNDIKEMILAYPTQMEKIITYYFRSLKLYYSFWFQILPTPDMRNQMANDAILIHFSASKERTLRYEYLTSTALLNILQGAIMRKILQNYHPPRPEYDIWYNKTSKIGIINYLLELLVAIRKNSDASLESIFKIMQTNKIARIDARGNPIYEVIDLTQEEETSLRGNIKTNYNYDSSKDSRYILSIVLDNIITDLVNIEKNITQPTPGLYTDQKQLPIPKKVQFDRDTEPKKDTIRPKLSEDEGAGVGFHLPPGAKIARKSSDQGLVLLGK